tara:strand:+ start:152 stop:511 length:360 start_codon:yes stop_codon:yes gene_type:complete
MKTNKEKEIFFNKISEQLEFDVMDYFQTEELEDINDYDELEERLQDANAFDIEIIYYAKAMDYLRENDISLSESMEIAQEYGYEPKNINSELLASLLASQNAREEFYELENEIEEFLTN